MLFSFLASCLVAVPTPVAMPGETEARRFKASFEQGEVLYRAGEYGAAIYNFKLADSQRVTPEVAYDLAKSHEKLGDLAFAVLYYRLYLRRAPEASDLGVVAEQVGQVLAKAESEGRGFFELTAPRARAVTVNGLRFAEPPVAMLLPAGDYEVEAEFPAGVKKMMVQVRSGRATTIAFEPLQPPLVAVEGALTAEVVAASLEAQSAGVPSVSGARVASYVIAGLGAAVVIVGSVLGATASADAARAKDKTLTVSAAQGLATSANTKGLTANVLFAAGGAAVVGGAVLFVFSMPEPGMKRSGGAR